EGQRDSLRGWLGRVAHAQAQLLLAGLERGGAGEQRGHVPVRADAEDDQVKDGETAIPRCDVLAQRLCIVARALLGPELSLHAMDPLGWKAGRLNEGLSGE